jgi:sugar/nucleoside kinase (ribokinase family)
VTPAVIVLGNLAVDLVDENPPSPGGCPSFAGVALAPLGEAALLVTRGSSRELPLFTGMLGSLEIPYRVLASDTTSSFGLRYDGDDRVLSVEAIGPRWNPDDVAGLGAAAWAHVAPLLRSDFSAETLEALAADGCQLSYDGQGLVRVPQLGPLTVDTDYDPGLLRHVRVLKLADDEADVVAGGTFDEAVAERLGPPEVLVTQGSRGCDLYVDAVRVHVPAAWPVTGVHSTGAGDMFAVTYVVGRAGGLCPLEAAQQASLFVARRLQERRDLLHSEARR